MTLHAYPLSKDRWQDFEELFGSRGACSGCWCMWWHLTRKEFELQRGAGTKALQQNRVDENQIPGLLLYKDVRAIAWCSLGPREDFALWRTELLYHMT